MNNKFKTIILAGGFGQRMNSNIPKVLHKMLDKTLISCVLDSCKEAGLEDIYIIVGHKHEMVEEHLKNENVTFVMQEKQLGTGHAVMCAEKYIDDTDNVIVINSDMPLLTAKSINGAKDYFINHDFGASLSTVILDDATGYGRIVRDINGNFEDNIQQKDATEAEKAIKEADLGMYLFKGDLLKKAFKLLTTNNAQKEYYLTDTLFHIKNMDKTVGVYTLEDNKEAVNVNSKKELAKMSELFFERTNEYHMQNGVTIISPKNSFISPDVTIGKDTVIYPGTILEGKTSIGENCSIGPNTRIINSTLENNITAESSKIMDSHILSNVDIGPFSFIRNQSEINKDTHVGPYCEIKNSNIGQRVKASHHLYLGDSDIGNNVEIGCGTITVNFDVYENKHRTVIKDNAFIGSNVNLVAPVTVGKNSVAAAGSTITKDIQDFSLAISRGRQENKDNWTEKLEK